MRIAKKYIRRLEANIPRSQEGATLIASFPVDEARAGRLGLVGFTSEVEVGETVLPSVIGPATRYNAEGRVIVHRDRPKETLYQQVEWTWEEWHGRDRVERTEFRERAYQRYPRTPVPPPAIELSVAVGAAGRELIAAPPLPYAPPTAERLMLCINLMLEIFGACDLLDEGLVPLVNVRIRRVNWTVLPKGRLPWDVLRPHLQDIIGRQRPGTAKVSEHRLKVLSGYGPEFGVVGHGGFAGYVIFAFPAKGLYVLECARYGNATYVFDRGWEALSQMTKAEILNGELHRARLVHVSHWESRVRELLR